VAEPPSRNVINLQRRAAGVLPVRVDVPRPGVSRQVKLLVVEFGREFANAPGLMANSIQKVVLKMRVPNLTSSTFQMHRAHFVVEFD
jgi:hypothetical protein